MLFFTLFKGRDIMLLPCLLVCHLEKIVNRVRTYQAVFNENFGNLTEAGWTFLSYAAAVIIFQLLILGETMPFVKSQIFIIKILLLYDVLSMGNLSFWRHLTFFRIMSLKTRIECNHWNGLAKIIWKCVNEASVLMVILTGIRLHQLPPQRRCCSCHRRCVWLWLRPSYPQCGMGKVG